MYVCLYVFISFVFDVVRYFFSAFMVVRFVLCMYVLSLLCLSLCSSFFRY